MKRGGIGLAILLVLLAAGCFATWFMDKTHARLENTVKKAGTLALAENWEGADRLVRRARQDWEKNRHISAALTDHATLEEIDSLLAQLEIYQGQREKLAFAATCAQIGSYLEDLGDAQDLTWWNLL